MTGPASVGVSARDNDSGSSAGISTSTPRLLLPDTAENRFKLSESPIWCEATGRLHWVSQEGDTGVHTLHLSTGEHTSMPTPALTPAVALTSDTDLLAVFLEQRVVLYSLKSGKEVRVLAEVPPNLGCSQDSWRFNDSRATPGGQIVAGRMNQERWSEGEAGWVLLLDRAEGQQGCLNLKVLFDKGREVLPNGVCWNLLRKTCYYNDTYTGKVHAIPCDATTGVPDPEAPWRTVLHLDEETEGAPDGLAIDRDGNLWVAHEQGGQVGVYDPDTGKKIHKIDMPVKRPSACAFGGPDLTQLFITTIQEEGDDAHPDSGKVFVVNVSGTAGYAGAHQYAL
eukprot:CAMPEP_0206149326 /NCGR_PEP_ID=MMETSP1473-20131121/37717_1 /ASSEMBLY_ACC=CAM_ASM_001109 /TAXON_ID=1461547 /ORGANISM="Stichococcus sp, Strain RCC1054" /LENGTH=337 /DNA_ID=CAMNT_0053546783 /DNA_START=3023 /DNA_END=4036 /DNA_ORIENTATION=+